ncbi:unnamed protein product [Rotaria sp. Silwood2]|nr:unnamed protein product [Rotaria sp. Silwood2]CAF4752399.1 unnamed protein product [Rotaria sp. Silwood2]
MSSSSTAELIVTIAEHYTIYTGFITLVFGVIGNISLIFVLTCLKIFRGSPSALYLITESITNLLQMAVLLTSRIAMNGFATDLTQTVLFWFWILHGIPFFIFSGIQSTNGCFIYNSSFVNYIIYFYYPILSGILPIIISTFFGVLAYRNVRRIVRRHMPIRRRKLDQQLTAMILIRVVFLVIMILPYVLERIYAVIFKAKHGTLYDAVFTLIDDVAYSCFHINYAGSFYLFLISSKRFRRQVKHAFIQRCWRICCTKGIQQNQVVPSTQSCISEDDF